MALALLTFVLSLTLVLASYWGLVLRPEARATAHLRRRLQLTPAEMPAGSSLVKRSGRDQTATASPMSLHRWLVGPVDRLIGSAGLQLNALRLVGTTLVAMSTVGGLLLLAHAGRSTAAGVALLIPLGPFV